jgi:hypothetical protein
MEEKDPRVTSERRHRRHRLADMVEINLLDHRPRAFSLPAEPQEREYEQMNDFF